MKCLNIVQLEILRPTFKNFTLSATGFWQFPKDSFNISDECWFQKRPIGKDTLASFMFTLSKKAGLSQIYTNHSIRATGATILGRNCSMAQIMAVTGHKSASSVAVYQRVSSKEKQVMGDIITSSVRGEQPSQLSSIMPPHSTSRLQLMPPADTKQFKFNITCSNESQYTCFIVGYGRR